MKRLTTTTSGHQAFVSRAVGQAMCIWCRRYMYDNRTCLTPTEKVEILAYMKVNGRRWKSKLAKEWSEDCDTLRSVRNKIGPKRAGRDQDGRH